MVLTSALSHKLDCPLFRALGWRRTRNVKRVLLLICWENIGGGRVLSVTQSLESENASTELQWTSARGAAGVLLSKSWLNHPLDFNTDVLNVYSTYTHLFSRISCIMQLYCESAHKLYVRLIFLHTSVFKLRRSRRWAVLFLMQLLSNLFWPSIAQISPFVLVQRV